MAEPPLVAAPAGLKTIVIHGLPQNFQQGRATTFALVDALSDIKLTRPPRGARTHVLRRPDDYGMPAAYGLLAELPTDLADRALTVAGIQAIAFAWNTDPTPLSARLWTGGPRRTATAPTALATRPATEDPARMLFFALPASAFPGRTLPPADAAMSAVRTYLTEHKLSPTIRLYARRPGAEALIGALTFDSAEAAAAAVRDTGIRTMRLSAYQPQSRTTPAHAPAAPPGAAPAADAAAATQTAAAATPASTAQTTHLASTSSSYAAAAGAVHMHTAPPGPTTSHPAQAARTHSPPRPTALTQEHFDASIATLLQRINELEHLFRHCNKCAGSATLVRRACALARYSHTRKHLVPFCAPPSHEPASKAPKPWRPGARS
jgi:hypothetical protein